MNWRRFWHNVIPVLASSPAMYATTCLSLRLFVLDTIPNRTRIRAQARIPVADQVPAAVLNPVVLTLAAVLIPVAALIPAVEQEPAAVKIRRLAADLKKKVPFHHPFGMMKRHFFHARKNRFLSLSLMVYRQKPYQQRIHISCNLLRLFEYRIHFQLFHPSFDFLSFRARKILIQIVPLVKKQR